MLTRNCRNEFKIARAFHSCAAAIRAVPLVTPEGVAWTPTAAASWRCWAFSDPLGRRQIILWFRSRGEFPTFSLRGGMSANGVLFFFRPAALAPGFDVEREFRRRFVRVEGLGKRVQRICVMVM
jgi:hypothetical protein